ncbi:sel1 repeat family protein [Pseudoxanthomonas koreensis]|uniref:sel1 repeat family protein n=1 Tax=Pseudoxanthomonas koreensis TaxID=266061 RepID=UPI001390E2DB|nr:sel1 repeat family protein [Pseudoxanthomonas koreensis]KAF1689353.1 hypothetical protein CSC64_12860 [Pseudoxanthomonas koreensis]
MSRTARLAILVLCLAAMPAMASGGRAPEIDPQVMTEGFLAAHPDLRWRAEGLRAYEGQDYARALEYFERAARYADKPSQAIIAGMYWEGMGVAQDRPLAYAWMDIAAERLYRDFLLGREAYWNALGEAGRADALRRGQAILAEYGDHVAKPRLEKTLRRAMRQTTGSRLGFAGLITIIPFTGPLAETGFTLRGDQYYDSDYWEPEAYWRLQDRIWKAPVREQVDVGGVEQVDPAGKPD